MKILGYEYTLLHNVTSDEMTDMGKCHFITQKIQIATDLHEQQITSTLLHEIIEAINYHLQLDLEHHKIMGLEAALYQTLVENGVDLNPLLRELQ